MKIITNMLLLTKSGIPLFLLLMLVILVVPNSLFAQGMMGQFRNTNTQGSTGSSTAIDEAEGKEIFDKLQSKQTDCKSLTDDEFDVLGDYFMGQRLGRSHETMNTMMKQMMGDEGEKQMHISLGKRLSGCDKSFPIPSQGTKFLPMMGMMGGNWGLGMMGGVNSGWGSIGGLIWILVIIFLIFGIIYFWKGITGKGRK